MLGDSVANAANFTNGTITIVLNMAATGGSPSASRASMFTAIGGHGTSSTTTVRRLANAATPPGK